MIKCLYERIAILLDYLQGVSNSVSPVSSTLSIVWNFRIINKTLRFAVRSNTGN